MGKLKKGMNFEQLALIVFAVFFGIILILAIVGKTNESSGTLRNLTDQTAVYKRTINYFTIYASADNTYVNLKWTIDKKENNAQKFHIYITPSEPEKEVKFFDGDKNCQPSICSLVGEDAGMTPRDVTFKTSQYFVGENMQPLVTARYNVLIRSYDFSDRLLGESRTVVNYVKS